MFGFAPTGGFVLQAVDALKKNVHEGFSEMEPETNMFLSETEKDSRAKPRCSDFRRVNWSAGLVLLFFSHPHEPVAEFVNASPAAGTSCSPQT